LACWKVDAFCSSSDSSALGNAGLTENIPITELIVLAGSLGGVLDAAALDAEPILHTALGIGDAGSGELLSAEGWVFYLHVAFTSLSADLRRIVPHAVGIRIARSLLRIEITAAAAASHDVGSGASLGKVNTSLPVAEWVEPASIGCVDEVALELAELRRLLPDARSLFNDALILTLDVAAVRSANAFCGIPDASGVG